MKLSNRFQENYHWARGPLLLDYPLLFQVIMGAHYYHYCLKKIVAWVAIS